MGAVKLGVVGLGHMGRNHVRVLSMLKSAQIEFIYDLDQKLARRVGQQFGLRVSQRLLGDVKRVDAVVIATPTTTHAKYVLAFAPHVKNIFVEKPLSHDRASSQRIVEAARRGKNLIQVGFIERFNPAVQQLRKLLVENPNIVNLDFTRTNKLSNRITDVDVVQDLMIHDIDLAILLNGPPKKIEAVGRKRYGIIEFASAFLTHHNGRLSRILASRITEKKSRLIEATCSNLFIRCELVRKEIVVNRQSKIRQRNGAYTISAIEETIEVPPQEGLLSELQTFLALCRGEGVDYPSAHDGKAAIEVCEQIRRCIVR